MPALKNCWEIKECGRARGGSKVAEMGECVASIQGMGHSCWAVAGTLCGGEVQGTSAQKEGNCMKCDVFKMYNRSIGTFGKNVKVLCPEEDARLNAILISRIG